jgi:hypothetical protein
MSGWPQSPHSVSGIHNFLSDLKHNDLLVRNSSFAFVWTLANLELLNGQEG